MVNNLDREAFDFISEFTKKVDKLYNTKLYNKKQKIKNKKTIFINM
jgi:hypothetical protein